ncbi:MAG TPA: hypothetical protein VK191_14065 [Symbiobacteriaceae bacterium]|nr:hypothetical protein [Symbiobacteriaceae bacterium]
MCRVYFGLMVDENGGVGRLVQAVHMLRSFGAEANIDTFSDVLRLPGNGAEPDWLCAVVAGESSASPGELQELCHRTDWALGEEGITLSAIREDGLGADQIPAPLDQLLRGEVAGKLQAVLPGSQFAVECDWADESEEESRWVH